MRMEYKSENGYTGKLYGERSMSIYDPNGKEVLHTGFRSINTLKALRRVVDGFPEYRKKLTEIVKDAKNGGLDDEE